MPSLPFFNRCGYAPAFMKKMNRDPGPKKPGKQADLEPKGYKLRSSSLEARVATFLHKAKGDDSIEALALKLGIPKMSLSRYLRVKQSMTLGTLQKIADALGVDTETILQKSSKH